MALLGTAISLSARQQTNAATVTKANNNTALNVGSSWGSGTAPTSADVALFDSTVTTAISVSQGTTLTWASVQVTNPGGTIGISQNTNTLTLNSGGIDMSSATADLSFNGTGGFVRAASANFSPNLNVAAGRTLTFNGQFNNQGNTKASQMTGSGTIIFNGNAGGGGSYRFNINGPTVQMNSSTNSWVTGTVASGTLVIGHATALQSQTITVAAANGLAFGTGVTSGTLGSLAGAGGFSLTNTDSNAAALTVGGNGGSDTYSGSLGGAGSLTKLGSGTLTLSGSNSFAGGLTVAAGGIVFNNSSAAASGSIAASNSTTLSLANSSSIFLTGTVVPSGANANVTLTSANASAGFNTAFRGSADQKFTINGATQVNVAASNQQFSGLSGTVAVATGATLRFAASNLNNGGTATTFDLTGGITTRNNGTLTLGALQGSGIIAMGTNGLNNQGLTVIVGDKGVNTTYSGVMSDADAANGKILGLTKVGSGTLTLTGSNAYTGPTIVTAGGLIANGVLGSGSLSVAATAWLAGSGTILGPVSMSGTISPGNSPGLLTLKSLSLESTSSTVMEINGTSQGTSYDIILVTDTSALSYGGGLQLSFGSVFADNTSFDLFSFSGTPTGTFAAVSATGTYGALTFTNNSGVWTAQSGGQTISFTESTGDILIVPEPSSVALLTCGCAFFFALRRRRIGRSANCLGGSIPAP